MSPLILKDMIGADADALGNHIVKNHAKSKQADCRIINDIYRLVKYHSQLFEIQRKRLNMHIKHSKEGTYAKRHYWYRNKYRKYVNERRLGNRSNH